ncbi:hypothetical protein ACFQ7M_41060 [Streptomyces massasporeus]
MVFSRAGLPYYTTLERYAQLSPRWIRDGDESFPAADVDRLERPRPALELLPVRTRYEACELHGITLWRCLICGPRERFECQWGECIANRVTAYCERCVRMDPRRTFPLPPGESTTGPKAGGQGWVHLHPKDTIIDVVGPAEHPVRRGHPAVRVPSPPCHGRTPAMKHEELAALPAEPTTPLVRAALRSIAPKTLETLATVADKAAEQGWRQVVADRARAFADGQPGDGPQAVAAYFTTTEQRTGTGMSWGGARSSRPSRPPRRCRTSGTPRPGHAWCRSAKRRGPRRTSRTRSCPKRSSGSRHSTRPRTRTSCASIDVRVQLFTVGDDEHVVLGADYEQLRPNTYRALPSLPVGTGWDDALLEQARNLVLAVLSGPCWHAVDELS